MIRSARWPLGLLLIAALSACGDRTTPAGQTTASPTPATPVATAAPQEAAPAATGAADGYKLTERNVDAYFEAQKKLAAAARTDPALDDFIGQNASEEDGAQYAQRLAGNAKVRGLIEQAGMSVRDFALTGELLITAMMAQGALEAGQLKTLPEGIDPDAVEFVKQHGDELAMKLQGK